VVPPAPKTDPNPALRTTAGPSDRILSISSAPRDHADLRRAVRDSKWRIATANSCEEGIAYLSRSPAFIIFCEYALPDGTWKRMLDHPTRLPEPTPMIVTSRLADDHLWAEVLNLGGFDVLAKPYNEREVRHVLESAWVQRVNPVRTVQMAGGV